MTNQFGGPDGERVVSRPNRRGYRGLILCAGLSAIGSFLAYWLTRSAVLTALAFMLGGGAALLLARRNRDQGLSESKAVRIERSLETKAERRARDLEIHAVWNSGRAQWLSWATGLNLVFVAGPAVIFALGGIYLLAFLFGVGFLATNGLIWRAGWRLHRTIPGVRGRSATWPSGSLSPADKRFMCVTGSLGLMWTAPLLAFALLADQVLQGAIIAVISLGVGVLGFFASRRYW